MNRICCKCEAYLGERCGRCSQTSVKPALTPLFLWEQLDTERQIDILDRATRAHAVVECLECKRTWLAGTDGVTHTYCLPCKQEMREILGHSFRAKDSVMEPQAK